MPTLRSRPDPNGEENSEFTSSDIVGMIDDAIAQFPGSLSILQLKVCINSVCQTLKNVSVITDYFIYPAGNGYDVGFRLSGDDAVFLTHVPL